MKATINGRPLVRMAAQDITVAGEVPAGFLIPGRWYKQDGVGTSFNAVNGEMRLIPYPLRQTTRIDRLGAQVITPGAAGSLFRLGIYADNGNGYPGALVVDGGAIDGTLAATQEVVVDTTLPRGLYWFGGVAQGGVTQPNMRAFGGQAFGIVGATSLAGALQQSLCYIASGIVGPLPATFPVGTFVGTLAAAVAMRIA